MLEQIKTIVEKLRRGEQLDRAESETAAEKLRDWIKIKEALKAGGRKSSGGGRKVQNDSPEAIKQREYMREYRKKKAEEKTEEVANKME
jgi:hypothetical protein